MNRENKYDVNSSNNTNNKDGDNPNKIADISRNVPEEMDISPQNVTYASPPSNAPPHAGAAAAGAESVTGPAPAGGYPLPAAATLAAKKPKELFAATRGDRWLAAFVFVLGFLFIRWMPWFKGMGITVFTILYAGSVLLYAKNKEIHPSRESWYWLGILMLTAIACGVWVDQSMQAWRFLLLFGAAVYWCGCLFGTLAKKGTSNYLPLDAINQLLLIPFKNYAVTFLSLKTLRREKTQENSEKSKNKNKKWLSIGAGVLLSLLLLPLLLPLLVAADSGGFTWLLRNTVGQLYRLLDISLWQEIWQFVLGVPVALYIGGLIMGSAHRRYTTGIDTRKADQTMQSLRLLPRATVLTVLGMVCGLYLVFILCQLPYFFSAFAGQRPQGYEVYSEYARSGFFELCRIAGINLLILCAANGLVKQEKKVEKGKVFRIFNLTLCGLTFILIATALSKMGMYVGAYGLSALRIQTSVFMLFLALVFGGFAVLQFRSFSLVKFAAITGSTLLCLLCLVGVDGTVARYNAAAYSKGSLPELDTIVLWNADADGYYTGINLYENEEDERKKEEIAFYLETISRQSSYNGILAGVTCSEKRVTPFYG